MPSPSHTHSQRIRSIDAMRGLVILIMLLDHVRERFYLHMQVSDPMDLDATSPSLFVSRFAAHFCAPVFVFLTGLSAWLYAHPPAKPERSARGFLFKRGMFLIALEVTLITFSWMGSYHTVWLQVMWAIGLSMIALSLLLGLPRWAMALIGVAIVFGHNLLTPLQFSPDHWAYSAWTILHDRGYLLRDGWINIKVSYPLLPWIGVILLGYVAGPLYALSESKRKPWLLGLGAACLILLAVLRGLNLYGETLPWRTGETLGQSLMSFFNFTKYPPSLSFLLITLGVMFLLLHWLEQRRGRWINVLVTYGSVPMFFYILHLYVLLIVYSVAIQILGANHGELLGVNHIGYVWLIAIALAVVLYAPTRWFSTYKKRVQSPWLKYL